MMQLAKIVIVSFIFFTISACYEAEMQQEGQQAVNSFLEEMSPELARKIDDIEAEITLTEEKINKLLELKLKHPNYVGKIESSRKQWEVLRSKLQHSLKEIRDVVESTYVTYELDRIQGGNQFNKISGGLLSSANSVLASAGVTKDAIEQALSEVDEQLQPIIENISMPQVIENTSVPEIINYEPINQASYCDMKISLADAHLNLMMLVFVTDKNEQAALKIELNKAHEKFEAKLINLLNNQSDNSQLAVLQNNWQVFKNTSVNEIIPAIQTDNNKALQIANGIQTERMNAMNSLLQNLSGDSCD